MKKTLLVICYLFPAVTVAVAADLCLTNFLDGVDSGTVLYLGDCGGLRLPVGKLFIVQGGETGATSIVKSNWGYVRGDGDASCQTNITFGSPFATIPDLAAACLGSTNAIPANRGDVRIAPTIQCSPQKPSTSGFTMVIIDVSGANISTNTYVAYSWLGKPAGSD
jgi:hypothetical protein